MIRAIIFIEDWEDHLTFLRVAKASPATMAHAAEGATSAHTPHGEILWLSPTINHDPGDES